MLNMKNIVEIAVETDDLSLLVEALTTANAGLVETLSGDGPFTVFAPTNAAFQALLDSDPSWTTLNDIPIETLVTVLTYHVVSARAFDKDLAAAVDMNNQIATVQGSNLTFDLTNLTINTSTNIAGVNTLASNGVIHVIDEVLLPPAN